MSQRELAKELHISEAAVSNWIKGKNSPDIDTLAKVCKILDVTIVEMFGTDGFDVYSQDELHIIHEYRRKTDLQKAIRLILGLEK